MPGWTCHSRAPSSPYVTDLLLVTQDADAGGWSWRRLGGPEVSTEIEHCDAQALAPRAHSSRVLAVVPGAQVGWHPVALPLKGARLLAAAPYALEDALAEDVEKLRKRCSPRTIIHQEIRRHRHTLEDAVASVVQSGMDRDRHFTPLR